MTSLRAPFPWFGGKSKVAETVWRAFGDVPNYVEPFAGSLAVLLGRPHAPRTETVNDLDCHLANFWRALRADPDAVAAWSDWPVNEADLHARHRWFVAGAEAFRARMHEDPEHFDVQRAGWWVWGVCSSIGNNWLRSKGLNAMPAMVNHGIRSSAVPSAAIGHPGHGVNGQRAEALEWFRALAERLRRVRVACGDWSRVLTGSVTGLSSNTDGRSMGMLPCAVFLDPPYEGEGDVYAEGNEVGRAVREWAIEHGERPELRIALCGYEGEHEMPASWTVHAWKAGGGYGNRRGGEANVNARRERIWFSPHCRSLEHDGPLFASGGSR